MVEAQIIIKGEVQGVFFRASARDQALKLGLNGNAKNLPDGSVEIVVQGERPNIEELLRWCHRGPEKAVVEEVDSTYSEPEKSLDGFQVL